MVRLITHNLLACHAKGCTANNFPLRFQDASVELRDADFNADFLRGFLPRLEWPALVDAARQVRLSFQLPVPSAQFPVPGLPARRGRLPVRTRSRCVPLLDPRACADRATQRRRRRVSGVCAYASTEYRPRS